MRENVVYYVTVTPALSLLLSIYVGELLLSVKDAAAGRVCVAGEWPVDLTEGSELGSASDSCCEAVAERESQNRT